MRLTHPLSILVLSLPLAACQNAPTVACGDPSGVDTVKTLIADAAQQAAQAQAEGKSSSIRAALSRFEVEFSAIRTDKKDPYSSKVFCAAQISVRLDPALLLTLEAEAKAIPSVGSLDHLAEQRGFERTANVFTKRDFSYSLQPTDDGSMVFAESSDHQPSTLLSDLALLDVVRTEKASRPAVNVQAELARIQSEQAKVQAAGQQLAADQQALATLQQQQLAAAQQAAQVGTAAPIASSPGVHAPGFNCARATLHAEQLICGNPTLSALDVRLNVIYKQALAATSQKESLHAGQVAWVEQRRNQCQSVACLIQAYTDRITLLSSGAAPQHALLSDVDDRLRAGGEPGMAYVNSPRDGFLSLRSHPSVKEGKRLIKIPHGTAITLFDCPATPRTTVDGVPGAWCTAEYDGVRGFVFDAYLSGESE